MGTVISFFGTDTYWLGFTVSGAVLAFMAFLFFGGYIENRVKDRMRDSRKTDARQALASLAAFLFLPWIWHLTLPLSMVGAILWLVWYASQDAFKKEEV